MDEERRFYKIAKIIDLDVKAITIDPDREVNTERVKRLAWSIRQIGLQSPIVVRAVNGGAEYVLEEGAHRLAAFRLLRRSTIPALVIDPDDHKARLLQDSPQPRRPC